MWTNKHSSNLSNINKLTIKGNSNIVHMNFTGQHRSKTNNTNINNNPNR